MDKIKLLTIGDKEFKINKFNAMEQFHVARRLAGLFSTSLQSGKSRYEQLSAFLDKIGEMRDEDAEALFIRLLSNTYIKEPNGLGYSPLVASGKLMRDDMDLTEYVLLGWEVLVLNLSNFTQQITALTEKPTPTQALN